MQTNYYKYGNKKFIDIYPDYDTFKSGIDTSFIAGIITDDNYKVLYNLLLGRYATAEINSSSGSDYWKCRLYNIIYEYAPRYFKGREIQDAVRKLDLDSPELQQGTKAIYNTALNPNTVPKTTDLDELEYINSQNTTNYKFSKLDSYQRLKDMLSRDGTTEFLNKFQKLFIQVLAPYEPLLYDYGD